MKRVKLAVYADYNEHVHKIEDLTIDIQSEQELFTDAVVNKILHNEAVEELS